ncbi:MAG: hypothetical protein H6Q20_1437 [Bacteroidetes bacterium]|nr:hypothetical protein [Bacteroidota bacterium]
MPRLFFIDINGRDVACRVSTIINPKIFTRGTHRLFSVNINVETWHAASLQYIILQQSRVACRVSTTYQPTTIACGMPRLYNISTHNIHTWYASSFFYRYQR